MWGKKVRSKGRSTVKIMLKKQVGRMLIFFTNIKNCQNHVRVSAVGKRTYAILLNATSTFET